MKQDSILEIKNVTKCYSDKKVICGLNFSISNNEIIAFLGVNGAGKTTTIKLILGQEAPTSGTIKLLGKNPQDPTSRIFVGATPQNIEFPEGIKTKEILEFVHAHYPSPEPISNMIEKFDLTSILNLNASKLSNGQKRKLALALAFIGNPKIVFLDEPTTGLDVQSRLILLDTIKEYHKMGKTIFLTTHYLEEIEQIATRIVLFQNGQITFDGSIDEFKKIGMNNQSKIIFSSDLQIFFDNFQYINSYEYKNSNYLLNTSNPDALIYELVENKVPFTNLQIVRENLESAFIYLTKGNE